MGAFNQKKFLRFDIFVPGLGIVGFWRIGELTEGYE
jgi:hypothetical protein